MRKINLSYGQGADSFLLSAKTKKILPYGRDTEKLHAAYGGRQYYTSCSGASGAGWIEDPQDDLLIPCGFYRVDARYEQEYIRAHTTPEGRTLAVYLPFNYRAGIIDACKVAVITDGTNVVFLPPQGEKIIETLKDWDIIVSQPSIKQILLTYYDRYYEKIVVEIRLFNPQNLRGVNALRFSKGVFHAQKEFAALPYGQTFGNYRLQEGRVIEIDSYFNYISDAWDVGEFQKNHSGIIATKNGKQVNLCQLRQRKERYQTEGLPEYIEYEQEIPAFEYFLDEEKFKKKFQVGMTRKERCDFVAAKTQKMNKENVKRILIENPDKVITLQDSIDCGNCEPTSRRFIEENGLKDPITFRDLSENSNIEEMLDNYHFRKVVIFITT